MLSMPVTEEIGEVLIEVKEATDRIPLGLAQVQVTDDEVIEVLGG